MLCIILSTLTLIIYILWVGQSYSALCPRKGHACSPPQVAYWVSVYMYLIISIPFLLPFLLLFLLQPFLFLFLLSISCSQFNPFFRRIFFPQQIASCGPGKQRRGELGLWYFYCRSCISSSSSSNSCCCCCCCCCCCN